MKIDITNHKIMECKFGSQLYGTATPTSDTDYIGVFVPPTEYLLGLDKVEEVDLSIKDKHENGKNTANAVDRKFYAIDKFLALAMQNNPNILELLFLSTNSIVYMDDTYKFIMDNYDKFVHAGLKDRFIGYAVSQKHKMVIKTDKFNEMNTVLDYLEGLNPRMVVALLQEDKNFIKIMDDYNKNIKIDQKGYTFCFHDNFLTVGDINILQNNFVKEAISKIKARIDKATNRTELVLAYGYDVKFGSHLIRLLLEGKELLETGKLVYPLTYAKEILDIKAGKFTVQEVLDKAEMIENDIRSLSEKNTLRKTADYNFINKMLIQIKMKKLFDKSDET